MNLTYKLLLLLITFPIAVIAQKTVTAESIIADINSTKPVALDGAEITGDLNLTKLNNMKPEPDYSGFDKTYISTVTSTISFINCTFTGKVLGYFNPDEGKRYVKSSTVYNTNFTGAVSFENCIFEKDVAFKYSVFNDKVSFANSQFNSDAIFKYTQFKQGPLFNRAIFKSDAIFKYVEFPSGSDFSQAIFNNVADFKYAKLNDGNFSKAGFKSGADFKYASFDKSVSFKDANFEGTSDLKYATLDSKKITLDELVNR